MIMVTPFLCLVVFMIAASATSAAASIDKVAHSSQGSYVAYLVAGPGQFLTTLAIGTPPVSFTAILDTGSDLVWRQCLPCQLCYPQSPLSPAQFCDTRSGASKRLLRHRHPTKCTTLGLAASANNSLATLTDIFDPSLSSSYSTAHCSDPACLAYPVSSCSAQRSCTYDTVYIAPTAYTRGIMSYDTLTISSTFGPPNHIPEFAFGCSHSSKAPYNFAGAGGIVGFGRSPLSLPSQLNVSRFSYCLGSINDTTSLSPLVLGAAASLGASARTQSTSILNIDYGYVVELIAISVAGEPINISTSSLGLNLMDYGVSTEAGGAGIIFDSGTTFLHLPPLAFQALMDAFRTRIFLPRASAQPRNLTLCYQSTGEVPSLSFHFNGATMHLPPQNYFISIEGVFCLALLESGEDLSIFGNVQQQNYHILYDLKANMISFKPTLCHALLHMKAANYP